MLTLLNCGIIYNAVITYGRLQDEANDNKPGPQEVRPAGQDKE